MTLPKAEATIAATKGVSVSHQLVRMLLERPEYSRKKES